MDIDFQRRIDTPLDYWSIMDMLSNIEFHNEESEHGEYFYDYAEQFNDLANLASILCYDLERLVSNIDYTWELPPRKREELGDVWGAYWFDTAAALLDETDLMLLQENEGAYDPDDPDTERAKRLRAVKALTKEQMTNLFTRSFNFLMRYLKLVQAYEMQCGLIDELRYLHSFRERNGVTELPPAAYVE